MVAKDFDCRVGRKDGNEEGVGSRGDKGQKKVDLVQEKGLKTGNTHFKKKRLAEDSQEVFWVPKWVKRARISMTVTLAIHALLTTSC